VRSDRPTRWRSGRQYLHHQTAWVGSCRRISAGACVAGAVMTPPAGLPLAAPTCTQEHSVNRIRGFY
jgi:hypothetical protein